MLDNDTTTTPASAATDATAAGSGNGAAASPGTDAAPAPRRRRAASRRSGPPPATDPAGAAASPEPATGEGAAPAPVDGAPAAPATGDAPTQTRSRTRAPRRRATAAPAAVDDAVAPAPDEGQATPAPVEAPAASTSDEPAATPAPDDAPATPWLQDGSTTPGADNPLSEPQVAAGTAEPEPEAAAKPRRRRRAAAPAATVPDLPDGDITDATPDAQVPDAGALEQPADAPLGVDVESAADQAAVEPAVDEPPPRRRRTRVPAAVTFQAPVVMFQPPEPVAEWNTPTPVPDSPPDPDEQVAVGDEGPGEDTEDAPSTSRRRRRGRRGRGSAESEDTGAQPQDPETAAEAPPAPDGQIESDEAQDGETAGTSRRRRRRRRSAGTGEDVLEPTADDPPQTVVKVREPRTRTPARTDDDEVKGIRGSTRMAAKRQRRQDGRDGGRKRPPIISESEFLARREAVDRVMVVRESRDRTQIAVLEDGILVEHYVTKASASSYVGNVYLGRVQNVLPSMEAAFVDIGKGRNAVLYAGEVNYDTSQFEGRPQRIEQALKSGQSVLVQVTKDPIGQKGSRLTSQVSLPGRYLVYVPEGTSAGISRKLPDTERSRLKSILKRITPEDAGVIVRTAAEGASEEELTRDIERLSAQWEAIQRRATAVQAPALLSAEPDLVVRVVRDVFNEDFTSVVVQGSEAWDTISQYVDHVAPDLVPRLTRWESDRDAFAEYRVDEQLAKALDRKVFLPSGGSLVIDRTEAMVVVDVNTGKFVGKGGNLEETVTRNNIEAAEEIVRQLRLRDLGGIIVIDFIDMVLESNRDLVLRRLLECLGRDRTKHQVAEVTSLGLVQMTRKRVGQGLLEAFSDTCPTCAGRGVVVALDPFAATDKPPVRGIPAALIPKSARPVAVEPAVDAGAPAAGADVADDSSLPGPLAEAVPAQPEAADDALPSEGTKSPATPAADEVGPGALDQPAAAEQPPAVPDPPAAPAARPRRRASRRTAGPPVLAAAPADSGHEQAVRE